MNDKEEKIQFLLTVKKVFDKNDIMFFPIWGTLLGFVREKGIISFDGDADIGVFIGDWQKVVDTFNEFNDDYNLGTQYRLANLKHTRLRIFIKPRNSTKHTPDMVGRKKMLGGLKLPFSMGIWFFDIDHKTDELFLIEPVVYRTRFPFKGFTTTEIYGKDFDIPVNAKEMVRLIYGDDWKTPIKNWKHPHICDHYFYKRCWFYRFFMERWVRIRNYRQVSWWWQK